MGTRRKGLFVNNTRFYILAFSLSISIFVVSYLRTTISADALYMIRVQQTFGFLALIYWYIALLATPLSSVLGKNGFMAHYLHSRRALGVSGAYFAVLHMLFGVFGQLGGPANLLVLPSRFQLAIILGGIGLVVLLAMAATSFDKVIKYMTFPRWKWLHRLAYPAIILVLIHVWIIGTHLSDNAFRAAILSVIIVLVVLESWRISKNIEKKSESEDPKLRLLIFACLVVIATGAAVFVPRSIDRYHSSHGASENGVSH